MKKVVVCLIIMLLFTTGCSIKKVQELSNAEKFAKEFEISSKNPFVYTNIDYVLNLLENGTGIIFFATSDYEGSKKSCYLCHKNSKTRKYRECLLLQSEQIKRKKSKEV